MTFSVFDMDALLAPVDALSPCGDDVEYTADFAALQRAAVAKPEQQIGDVVVAAVEPDWADVVSRCIALARRTHDLRIAATLAQALLHVDGLPGFAAGLSLVRAYVEREWDEVWPRLDADDGFDPAIRLTALARLAHAGAVVRPLRERTLLDRTLAGALSLNAIQRALAATDAPADDEAPAPVGPADVEAAFEMAPLAELQALADAARAARDDIAAIEAELQVRVDVSRVRFDFEPLARTLAEIESLLAPVVTRRAPVPLAALDAGAATDRGDDDGPSIEELLASLDAAVAATGDEAATPAGPAPVAIVGDDCASIEPPAPAVSARAPAAPPAGQATSAVPTFPTELRSRDDVARALAALLRYFAEREPGHPAPLLLERAQRWMSMDCMALLQDLAPEAAEAALRLRGAA